MKGAPVPLHSNGGAPTDQLPQLLAAFARAEFKAPAEAISGLTHLLAEDCVDPSHFADVVKLQAGAERLEAIVSGLLDPAKAEQAMVGQDPAAFSRQLRHELRTPITAILGYAELLVEDAEETGRAATLGLLADVTEAARRFLAQIDGMVEFMRLELEGKSPAGNPLLEQQIRFREPAAAIKAVMREQPRTSTRAVGRILIVDDNSSTLDLLSRRLGRDGHHVVACDNGEGALELLAGQGFDLLLLDLLMPGLSGIDVLRRLRSNGATATLPVLIISALDEVESAVHCIEAGADDYLTKPINPVLLRARIDASLERKFLRDREQAVTQQLRAEQQRSDSLLRNVLPRSVVERLRSGAVSIADHFESATILFSDLVGFTAFASRLRPDEVLDFLNGIFSRFDRLADQHGLEKIKTIGDAYMAAGGLPQVRPDHASAIADMALAMPREVEAASLKLGADIQIRIGVHTGPVAAGIIGRNKFIYDVWGDTVNIANRMELHGEPGRVHVSAATFEALGGRYLAEARDPIEVKGCGLMSTYFVSGRVAAGRLR